MRTLAVGDVRLEIDEELGCRATSWTVGDLSLLSGRSADPVEHGMYPMAPWAGRLRDNAVRWSGLRYDLPASYQQWALHGVVLGAPLEIVDHGSDEGSAWLQARTSRLGAWPWPGHVDVTWHLTTEVLTTTISVVAEDRPFPAVVGWHPWFRRRLGHGGDLRWTLEATGRLERGADHLPTGRVLTADLSDGPFDDAFVVPDGRAVVHWPGALRLDVAANACWYVVFDELPDVACLEPQSGPPDGVNDGYGSPVPIASADQPQQLVTTWTMHREMRADQG